MMGKEQLTTLNKYLYKIHGFVDSAGITVTVTNLSYECKHVD